MTIRIGAVSYLNTKPLIYGFEEHVPDAELLLDLPSRLASQLAGGRLDIGLIPSVEYLRNIRSGGSYQIISNACIACRGPVRSVQLLFRKDPGQIETLSLDEGSRTSAVLAQVLLAKRYGIRPEIRTLSMEADFQAEQSDATVIIGDRAMHLADSDFVETWDLGEQWQQQTGLPFVFAMWVARVSPGVDEATAIARGLERCRDAGLQQVSQIAKAEAPHYQLSEADCLKYFTEQLHFHLGSNERAGLDLFQHYANELQLLSLDSTQLSTQTI